MKCGNDNEKCKKCEFKYRKRDCCLQQINVKDDVGEYICLCCSKWYQKKKQFVNVNNFSNHNVNNFILLLRKVVYSCEYKNDWEKFKNFVSCKGKILQFNFCTWNILLNQITRMQKESVKSWK